MAKVIVVNKYKSSYTVYIGRGSVFGNKYTHRPLDSTKATHQVASSKEAIECFEKDLLTDKALMAEVRNLHGTGAVLGCFCKPKACHGDVIAKYANMSDKKFNKLRADSKRNTEDVAEVFGDVSDSLSIGSLVEAFGDSL